MASRLGAVAVLVGVRIPLLLTVFLLASHVLVLISLLAVYVAIEAVMLWKVWPARQRARIDEAELRAVLAVERDKARVDQIRADLIATVSHEFRTPLTAVRGTALTLIKRGEHVNPAAREQLLRSVLDQQERLSRLLENMLVAAEAVRPDESACAEVDAVAAEVALLAGAKHRARPRVVVEVERGLQARIDRSALHQVLSNLVDNAQQHGDPGSAPVVRAGSAPTGVWIGVSSTGTALDDATLASLFEPFTQGDTSATRARGGLGMGLYVVRRLVEVHHGTVLVRREGVTTTVEVRLDAPLRSADADVLAESHDQALADGAASVPGSPPVLPRPGRSRENVEGVEGVEASGGRDDAARAGWGSGAADSVLRS